MSIGKVLQTLYAFLTILIPYLDSTRYRPPKLIRNSFHFSFFYFLSMLSRDRFPIVIFLLIDDRCGTIKVILFAFPLLYTKMASEYTCCSRDVTKDMNYDATDLSNSHARGAAVFVLLLCMISCDLCLAVTDAARGASLARRYVQGSLSRVSY